MIYLDNAATTYPKPLSVVEEVRRCMLVAGGNPGRGAHSLSLAAARRVFDCRTEAAELFGAKDADRVFFTPNTTYGINAVLKGILRHGDHVIISDMEHNAVWRPVSKMAEEGMIEFDVFRTLTGQSNRTPEAICANIERLIRPNTVMVFCTHASNICSATMPIAQIGALCHKRGIFFAVDGAQSGGRELIDVTSMNIDALCLPGHKGLYGPQGSGMVVLGEEMVLDTIIEGGNGVDSLAPEMSLSAPERYEAGTLSTPAIAGLCEGIRTLRRIGIEQIAEDERRIGRRMREVLGNIRGVTLYAPEYEGGTVLFNVRGKMSESVAAYLDEQGICVRGGYHCAALAHMTLGTPDGGAVRVSTGMYNDVSDADALYRAIKALA